MSTPSAQAVQQQIIPVHEPKIVRGGNQITLPEAMTYAQARDWLAKQEQAEEKRVDIKDFIPCFPLDGMVALGRTMRDIYGFTELRETDGFWGPEPPMLIQIATPKGIETAVIGKLCPPKWEGGYIEAQPGADATLIIGGQIKRKFEGELKTLLQKVREKLKTDSIYKGEAINLDLSYMTEERRFHPINDAPKFMELSNGLSLILNKQTDFELSTSLFMLLERTEECRNNRISLKHGVLLSGGYGTGKTLTARVIAHKATEHGWTFIYLKKACQLASALTVANLYSPAVVFAEDVDQVVGGDRDADMNDILNTLDGVDTKTHPIITVLTTNHPEKIQPAFIRAGRIDTVIRFTEPDAETSIKFVQLYAKDDEGRSLIKEGESLAEAGHAIAGMVPAFICEAVAKAKRFAIYREGSDIVGKMTAEDLVLAANSIKSHIKMAELKPAPTQSEELGRLVGEWMNECLETNALNFPVE